MFFFQDEILSYSEKMTLKLDDLVNLIVHNVTWIEGRKAVPDKALLTHHEHAELAEAFKMNSYGLSYKDIQKETETVGKLCCDYIQKYSRPIRFLYFYRPINIIFRPTEAITLKTYLTDYLKSHNILQSADRRSMIGRSSVDDRPIVG